MDTTLIMVLLVAQSVQLASSAQTLPRSHSMSMLVNTRRREQQLRKHAQTALTARKMGHMLHAPSDTHATMIIMLTLGQLNALQAKSALDLWRLRFRTVLQVAIHSKAQHSARYAHRVTTVHRKTIQRSLAQMVIMRAKEGRNLATNAQRVTSAQLLTKLSHLRDARRDFTLQLRV